MGLHQLDAAVSVIRGRRREVEGLVNTAARRAMTAASDYLTAETPVKTGLARSNWVATVSEPFESIIPPYAPYEDLGAHEAAPPDRKFETSNRDAARAQNQTAFRLFDYAEHRVIFLRNNAEHVGLLKDGRSLQSPRGWWERVVPVAIAAMTGIWKLKA